MADCTFLSIYITNMLPIFQEPVVESKILELENMKKSSKLMLPLAGLWIWYIQISEIKTIEVDEWRPKSRCWAVVVSFGEEGGCWHWHREPWRGACHSSSPENVAENSFD